MSLDIAHTHIFTHTHSHIHTCMCTHIHAHTYAHSHASTCAHKNIQAHTYAHHKACKSNAGHLEYKWNFAEISSFNGRGQVYITWCLTNHISMPFSAWGPSLPDASFCSSVSLEPFPCCAFHLRQPHTVYAEQSSTFPGLSRAQPPANPRRKTKGSAQTLLRRGEGKRLNIFMFFHLTLRLSWQIQVFLQNTNNYVDFWNVFPII